MTGKQSSSMDKAERLVTLKGRTPPQAAKESGVAVNSIYRAAWYKKHRAAQKAAQ